MATLNIKNFPDRLHKRIKQRAAGNRRSIAQEVVSLLDEATSESPRISLLELEGLGKDLWKKELEGRDAAAFIAEERDYGEDVDIALGPAGILALAVASLARIPPSDQDLLTRKIEEQER